MQPGSLAIETLGFIAAFLTTLSFLPQALRIRRLGSADDVSLTMYLMMISGQGLWLIYGIVIASPSMIGANVVAMSFVAWVLVMKLRHLKRLRAQADLRQPAPAPAE
jgi:MtN3 and saliva related transmembrane protein